MGKEILNEVVEDGQLISEIDGYWDVVTCEINAEGLRQTVVTRATKHSTKVRPLPTEVDLEMFTRQANPTIIRPTKRQKPIRTDKLTMVIPDIQIGWRGDEPFHDERAMAAAQLAVREFMPDEVIFIGDSLDLPAMSRYEQRHDWQQTTQRSIDRYHEYLAQTRANVPDAKIAVLEGNHSLRQERYIRNNAAELLGLRRANIAEELGVLTLPFLLRLDELEAEWVGGYPNGVYYIQDNIQAIHGRMSKSGASTASALLKQEALSTVQGHNHRLELAYRTVSRRVGSEVLWAMTAGSLCRTDGGVPSGSYSTNERNETVIRHADWQQGFALIESNPETSQPTLVHIHDGGFRAFGGEYQIP